VRGVFEVNLILRIHQSAVIEVFLLAKRLKNGGVMQPKDLLLRKGLHSLLGSEEGMLVKVFGDKHAFVKLDRGDLESILRAIDEIAVLDDLADMGPSDLYSRVKSVRLKVPMDVERMKDSRDLLALSTSPLASELALHRSAQSLFPHPLLRKKGSRADSQWKEATADILRGIVSKDVLKIAERCLLIAVRDVKVGQDGYSVLSIYGSSLKVFVPGIVTDHGGGVVLYRIDAVKNTIKRQVRVLCSSRERDMSTQPRSSSIRYAYERKSNGENSASIKFLTDQELFVRKCKILSAISECQDINYEKPGQATCVAGLAALGVVDSAGSVFNNIVGMIIGNG
jgi:hypothetical protein